jgi:hypothetical protein
VKDQTGKPVWYRSIVIEQTHDHGAALDLCIINEIDGDTFATIAYGTVADVRGRMADDDDIVALIDAACKESLVDGRRIARGTITDVDGIEHTMKVIVKHNDRTDHTL